MTRDPMSVLREVAREYTAVVGDKDDVDAVDEALAQVEALAEAADNVQYADMEHELTDELVDELRRKLQPFTPAPDSEARGHG